MSNSSTDLISNLTAFNPKMKIYLEVEKQLEHSLDVFQKEWEFGFIQLALMVVKRTRKNTEGVIKIQNELNMFKKAGLQSHKVFEEHVLKTLRLIEGDLSTESLTEINDLIDTLNNRILYETTKGFTLAIGMANRLQRLLVD